jgi:hypothetical protein
MSFSIRCLILGHDDKMVRAPDRLSLRCDHCNRETPGWHLGQTHPVRTPRSKARSVAAPYASLSLPAAEPRVPA